MKAIQVTGWHVGGQDQAYPDHSVDPRLGTFEEFAAAIKATQKLGVKVILFTKYLWADQSMDWFRHGCKSDAFSICVLSVSLTQKYHYFRRSTRRARTPLT